MEIISRKTGCLSQAGIVLLKLRAMNICSRVYIANIDRNSKSHTINTIESDPIFYPMRHYRQSVTSIYIYTAEIAIAARD